jgi:hypothetical protein
MVCGLKPETTIICKCCGQQRKLADMKYIGIQDGVTYDLALFNCPCESTQGIRIPRRDQKNSSGQKN